MPPPLTSPAIPSFQADAPIEIHLDMGKLPSWSGVASSCFIVVGVVSPWSLYISLEGWLHGDGMDQNRVTNRPIALIGF